MKNFSQLITEPNKYIKSDTNEFVGVILASSLLAFACAPLVGAAAKGMNSFWDFLFNDSSKDKDSKDKDSKDKDSKDKDSKDDDKSKQNNAAFNSLLMLAKESNKNEKNKNEKSKNDAMLKLLTACSFDKDGNEIPLEDRINKMKDTMSDEQFEAFKKDMTDTYEKNKDNQDFKDALAKAKSNIKPEEYDKMLEDAKKEAKSTLEQIDKEKKEIEEYSKKIQELDDEINGGDEKDKEIRELKKQLEELKNNPPQTIASTATGVSSGGSSSEEKSEEKSEDDINKEFDQKQEDLEKEYKEKLDKETDEDKKKEIQAELDKKKEELKTSREKAISDNKSSDSEQEKKPEDYSNEDIEKMQDEISDLDPEKDKDKIKEKEDLLKSIAKSKGKSDDEYLPKVEKGSDGKQYQRKTGPQGGKYYRVKSEGESWGPWNSGEPANESLRNYLLNMLYS